MTAKQREKRAHQIKAAMTDLAHDARFQAFIEQCRNDREVVMFDLCNDAVVADQRASMAAVGEIRCYNNIISTYESLLETPDTPLEDGSTG